MSSTWRETVASVANSFEIGREFLVGDGAARQPAVRDDAENHVGLEHAAPRPVQHAGRHHRATEIRAPLDIGDIDLQRRAFLRIERAFAPVERDRLGRADVLRCQCLVVAPLMSPASTVMRYRVSFLYFMRCGMTASWPSRRILSFS